MTQYSVFEKDEIKKEKKKETFTLNFNFLGT